MPHFTKTFSLNIGGRMGQWKEHRKMWSRGELVPPCHSLRAIQLAPQNIHLTISRRET